MNASEQRQHYAAVKHRLFNPAVIGVDACEPRPSKFADLPAQFVHIQAGGHGKQHISGGVTRETHEKAIRYAKIRARQARAAQYRKIEDMKRAHLEHLALKAKAQTDSISIALAEQRMTLAARPERITIDYIINVTADQFGMLASDLIGPGRTCEVVLPRQVAMYLAKAIFGKAKSFCEIGLRFGKRDHTTVLHAFRRVGALMAADPQFEAKVLCIHDLITKGASA